MSAADSLAARPAHVPPTAVFAFDFFRDPALLADPHERVRDLIATAPPLFWTPCNGGHWMTLRHADCVRVLRDPDTFSSATFTAEQKRAAAARLPDGVARIPENTPVAMDPPAHTLYRAPLQKFFSPTAMMALKADIETVARGLVAEVAPLGACDFMPTVAVQFPVRVFLTMMGLPAERLSEFRELVRLVFSPLTGHDRLEFGLRLRAVGDAMADVIEARRAEPRDDLISQLWMLEVDGRPMTRELIEDYAVLLFLAGLDTVINAIGYAVRHLAGDPALQARLRADPGLIADAVEEMLRRYTFTTSVRRVTRDVELGGLTLKADEIVQVYLPASGLDAAEFAEPHRFRLGRGAHSHNAFGAGPHRCPGMHLARIELQTIYRVVLDQLPEFRLDPDRPAQFHAGNIIAVAALPLRWD